MKKEEGPTALKKIYDRLHHDKKVKNQIDFAQHVKYHDSALGKMIKGTKPLTYAFLVSLYKVFDVNINFIISEGEGSMFLNETEKITKKDLDAVKESREQIEELKKENEVLKKMISDKELIIDLFKNKKP